MYIYICIYIYHVVDPLTNNLSVFPVENLHIQFGDRTFFNNLPLK